MSKQDYTKGPWEVSHERNRQSAFVINIRSETEFICEATINQANACLISSAPELLEALESTLQLLREQTRKAALYESASKIEVIELNETIGRAERVIRKARGE
jgi:hypothetical protein